MKKYKFKLDALLKIRRVREDQCKMIIGRLQVQMTELKNEVVEQNTGINEAYDSQEEYLSKGINGQEIQFYPYFVDGKRAHIEKLNAQIEHLQKKIDAKFLLLNKLRADVKVIEKMKEKDMTSHRKKMNKKIDETVEEQVSNWRATNKL